MSTSATASDASAMHELGRALATTLVAGDVLLLCGPLGAGKTTLTQGIAQGLGVKERVTSPTFVIARVHRSGRIPLIHCDAYRLSSTIEIDDLDLEADMDDAVTVIEWGEGKVEQLADNGYLVIDIDRESLTGEARQVSVAAINRRWGGW